MIAVPSGSIAPAPARPRHPRHPRASSLGSCPRPAAFLPRALSRGLINKRSPKLLASGQHHDAMPPNDTSGTGDVFAQLQASGQEHILAGWNFLEDSQQHELLASIKKFDTSRCNRIFKTSVNAKAADNTSILPPRAQDVCRIQDVTQKDRVKYLSVGYKMIANGKYGVILMAGGQGTRLGSSAPKGCYDIGLPSGKSLFQLQAERILRVQQLAAESIFGEGARVTKPVRWYVMTSPMTHEETEAFFQKKGYFGLLKEQVVFFQQGTMPCFTAEGKLIMSSASSLAEAPDGNGGLYRGLSQWGCLADMRRHGVEAVDCVSVDNALVRVCDPVFAGYCRAKGAEAGARVVSKAYPEEKVGVFARRANGATEVVEYSDIDPALATSETEDGDLRFNWGNVCMHYFTRSFLERAESALEKAALYHVARKQIPSKDGPVDGIKLEMFIFDTFPLAKKVSLFEVIREEEFAPVKNAPGSATDSPGTARDLLLSLHAGWAEYAGAQVEPGAAVEVSPLLSYGGEDLEEACSGRTLRGEVELKALPAAAEGGGGGGGGGGAGGGGAAAAGRAGGSAAVGGGGGGPGGSGAGAGGFPFAGLAKAALVALAAGVCGSVIADGKRKARNRQKRNSKYRVLVAWEGERQFRKLKKAVPGLVCIRGGGFLGGNPGPDGCDAIQVGTYSFATGAQSVENRLKRDGFPAYHTTCVVGTQNFCD